MSGRFPINDWMVCLEILNTAYLFMQGRYLDNIFIFAGIRVESFKTRCQIKKNNFPGFDGDWKD